MAQRPTKKTPEVIQRLLDGIADGVTLRALCREDGMPNWRTVYDWIEADADLAAQVARARELGFDAIAEDVFDIADGTRAISEHVQLSKMRIDTRLKLLACWNPKKYGSKATVDVGNKEGETLKVDNGVDTVALTLQLAEALRAKGDDK
jgi:hypothetical protein